MTTIAKLYARAQRLLDLSLALENAAFDVYNDKRTSFERRMRLADAVGSRAYVLRDQADQMRHDNC